MIGHIEQTTLFVKIKNSLKLNGMHYWNALNVYDDMLQKASANFKISYEHAHELGTYYGARSMETRTDGYEKLS